jgi:membrane protease YdiL (CAAX protease family)
MLAGYVLAVALVEETLFRQLVSTHARSGRRAAALATAAASSTAFVAAHVRRDGLANLPAHAVNAAAWTASALVGRTVRWSVAGHAAYNYVAMSVREAR